MKNFHNLNKWIYVIVKLSNIIWNLLKTFSWVFNEIKMTDY